MSMLFGTPTDIEFLSMLSQSYKLGFNEGRKEAKKFMDCIPTDKLIELCDRWEKEAFANIPDAYTSRALEHKYLRGDNTEAGWMDCVSELRELVEKENG